MKYLPALIPLLLSILLAVGSVYGGSLPKVGDPIESVYDGLVKVQGSDSWVLVQDACPQLGQAATVLHRAYYGPPGATIASSTASEFDIVGSPHPFAALTYPADSQDPDHVFLAGKEGLITQVTDDPASLQFCASIPQ